MKKQIIILLLFSVQLSAQTRDPNPHFPKLKISVPCSQEFLNNYNGKWLITAKPVFPNNNYSQGATERINEIHQLVKQFYPQPVGSDGYWQGSYSKSDFAYTIKYVTEDGRTQKEYLKRLQAEGWSYHMILFAWSCTENANEIRNGYPDVSGLNWIQIDANRLTVLTGEFVDDDVWTIDGRPIKTKMPVIGTWKGYDVMGANGGYYADQNDEWFIMISRNDMLPYIPVTRKQYLDRAIIYITKFYGNLIAGSEQIPDQTERDENKKRNREAKDIAVKNLQNELQKTTNEGQLNAAAVVRRDAHFQTEGPIFLSEKNGGVLLTTENPEYFQKNLPGYIPQLFVVSWNKNGSPKWCADFKEAIEENFPVEKLQAMIDK